MSEPIFRAAAEAEDGAVAALLAEAFSDNPKADPAVRDWQYHANPYGPPVVWVWEEDGRIVGTHSAIPVGLVVDGRPTGGAFGIDAAVAPSHQGRRLFSPLTAALYEDLGRRDVGYVLSYPSTPSRRGLARAGWVEVDRLVVDVLALDDSWLAERFRLPPPLASGIRTAAFRSRSGPGGGAVGEPPAGLDELFARLVHAGRYRTGVARDAQWWRWRYAAHPRRPYRFYEARAGGRLVGAAVVVTKEAFGGRFGYVLELLAEDRDAARALSTALRSGEEGHTGLVTVNRRTGWGHRLARWAGFRRLPRRLEPQPQFFGAVPAPRRRDPRELAWNVAWGDLDHL